MDQVPKSVAVLKTKVDFFVQLHNGGGDEGVQIVQPTGLHWEEFARQWAPLCEPKTGAVVPAS